MAIDSRHNTRHVSRASTGPSYRPSTTSYRPSSTSYRQSARSSSGSSFRPSPVSALSPRPSSDHSRPSSRSFSIKAFSSRRSSVRTTSLTTKGFSSRLEDVQALPPIPEDILPRVLAETYEDSEGDNSRSVRGVKWALVLLSIYTAIFLFAMNNTIVANIQSAIVEEFGDVRNLPWVPISFLLSAAASNFVWSRIYSQFEVKFTFLAAIVIFGAGSALCGAAPSMETLIGGRVIAGVGAQGIYLGAMTFVGALATTQERPLYLSLGGIIWGMGIMHGPVVGGAFVSTNAHWRWSFYITLVAGGLFVPVYLLLLPQVRFHRRGSVVKRIEKTDYLGLSLLIVSGSLLVVPIVLGGIRLPWKSATVIGCFVASGVAFVLLILQQRLCLFTSRRHRIYPTTSASSLELFTLCTQASFASGIAFVPIYFVPLYLQITRRESAIQTALDLFPLVVSVVVSCLASGALMVKFHGYWFWFFIAGVCAVPGGAMMYSVGPATSITTIYGGTILLGIGAGLSMQLPFSVVPFKESPKNIARVNSVITQVQVGGLATWLAVSYCIFLNVVKNTLTDALPDLSTEQISSLINITTGGLGEGLDPTQLAAATNVIVSALQKVYIPVMIMGAANIFTSLLVFTKTLHSYGNDRSSKGDQ